jgi:SNF2 family DNA or RNA helicase
MEHDQSADWSECGTGKSLTALAKFAILKHAQLAKTMLIVCPLSVMGTWEDEIQKHTNFTFQSLTGSIAKKVEQLQMVRDIFIVSYDTVKSQTIVDGKPFVLHLMAKRFDFIVCDEATMIKSRKALRTRVLIALCDKIPYRLFMSGTPVTNDPTSIFTIYRAMDGGKTFGRNIWIPRQTYFRDVGWKYPQWEVKPEMREALRGKLYERAIRVVKEECFDMPPKVFTSRYCELQDRQRGIYYQVASELIEELNLPEGQIRLPSILAKIIKLSQITGGFAYTTNQIVRFNPNPKLELLKETLELIPQSEKVVIFCRWVEEVEVVANAIGGKFMMGNTSLEQRQKIIDEFTQGDLRYLVSQQSIGGYGLNLQVSSNVIYYSVGFSVIDWEQSQDRIHRAGQVNKCVYYLMIARGTIDEYILRKLLEKQEISSSLTNHEEQRELKSYLERRAK